MLNILEFSISLQLNDSKTHTYGWNLFNLGFYVSTLYCKSSLCDAILFSAADFVKQVLSNQNVSLSLCVLSNLTGLDDKKNLPFDSRLARHQTVRRKNKNFAYVSQWTENAYRTSQSHCFILEQHLKPFTSRPEQMLWGGLEAGTTNFLFLHPME